MWVAPALLLCCLGLARGRERGEGRVVRTAQGEVRGYPSEQGEFYAFYGIPYATAPTGRDKFKAPLPPPEWNKVFEATDDKIACVQNIDFVPLSSEFQEDCLVVNVFVPKGAFETNKKLQVLVIIHGGAFVMGSGNMGSHEALLRHDIIVVNFNYRLGIYGFLCLGTEDIPGNAGMKDQVAALRWVQRNIATFGGNPDDVTLGGYSAGGASVELLMMSPMAKGLFAKVDVESGSGLSAWAVQPDPLQTAKQFIADISGDKIENVMEMEEFYKSLTMNQLVSKSYFRNPEFSVGFSPCIERKFDSQESFLNESPLDILKSGEYNKVPYLAGMASKEGLFRIHQFDDWKDKMNTNFADFLPRDLTFADESEKKIVAEKVKQYYFKDEQVSFSTIEQFVDYITDALFAYPMLRSARLHVANSVPVYLYEYTFANVAPTMPNPYTDKITGADHCAQSMVLHKFKFVKSPDKMNENEVLMEDRLSKLWADFTKFGNPVKTTSDLIPVPWDPMDADSLNYLSIGLKMQRKGRFLGEKLKFWDSIYGEYYRKPQAPVVSTFHTEL